MASIDPIEIGKLIADMETMKASMLKMEQKMEIITEMAHQWRGALWFAGIAGGILSSIATIFATKMQWLAGIFR